MVGKHQSGSVTILYHDHQGFLTWKLSNAPRGGLSMNHAFGSNEGLEVFPENRCEIESVGLAGISDY